jgi:hypothetical protein
MPDILTSYPNWKSIPDTWVVKHLHYDGSVSSLLDSVSTCIHEVRNDDLTPMRATLDHIKICYSLHITIPYVRGLVIVGKKRAWLIENKNYVNTERCIRFEFAESVTECCNRSKFTLIAIVAVLIMSWVAIVAMFDMIGK